MSVPDDDNSLWHGNPRAGGDENGYTGDFDGGDDDDSNATRDRRAEESVFDLTDGGGNKLKHTLRPFRAVKIMLPEEAPSHKVMDLRKIMAVMKERWSVKSDVLNGVYHGLEPALAWMNQIGVLPDDICKNERKRQGFMDMCVFHCVSTASINEIGKDTGQNFGGIPPKHRQNRITQEDYMDVWMKLHEHGEKSEAVGTDIDMLESTIAQFNKNNLLPNGTAKGMWLNNDDDLIR